MWWGRGQGHTEIFCQVEVSPFCQSFWEVRIYFLQDKTIVVHHSNGTSQKQVKIRNGGRLLVVVVWRLTNLGIRSSPVNPMNDIDVNVCESFGKSEKLSGGRSTKRTLKWIPPFYFFPQRSRNIAVSVLALTFILYIYIVQKQQQQQYTVNFTVRPHLIVAQTILATCCKTECSTPTLWVFSDLWYEDLDLIFIFDL